jgi:hypothetical protein
MTVNNSIRAAIETYLTGGGSPLIPDTRCAFENTPFNPATGTWWGRITVFASVNRQRVTVGQSAVILEGGFVDIGLFYPEGKGAAEAETKADQIIAALEGGTIVSSADGNVHFDTPQRTGAIQENKWYQINITAPYRFYKNT